MRDHESIIRRSVSTSILDLLPFFVFVPVPDQQNHNYKYSYHIDMDQITSFIKRDKVLNRQFQPETSCIYFGI